MFKRNVGHGQEAFSPHILNVPTNVKGLVDFLNHSKLFARNYGTPLSTIILTNHNPEKRSIDEQ